MSCAWKMEVVETLKNPIWEYSSTSIISKFYFSFGYMVLSITKVRFSSTRFKLQYSRAISVILSRIINIGIWSRESGFQCFILIIVSYLCEHANQAFFYYNFSRIILPLNVIWNRKTSLRRVLKNTLTI